MTPKELTLYAKAYSDKQKQELIDNITLAYLNSLWTIQWLGKKSQQPKSLEKILDSIGKEKEVMTDEQMLKKVIALNKLFGGEVVG